MTIRDATAQAQAALAAGDLDRLALALDARGQAILSGETPTLEAFEQGEQLLSGLRDYQRQAACDSARAGQVLRYIEFRK